MLQSSYTRSFIPGKVRVQFRRIVEALTDFAYLDVVTSQNHWPDVFSLLGHDAGQAWANVNAWFVVGHRSLLVADLELVLLVLVIKRDDCWLLLDAGVLWLFNWITSVDIWEHDAIFHTAAYNLPCHTSRSQVRHLVYSRSQTLQTLSVFVLPSPESIDHRRLIVGVLVSVNLVY